MNQALYAHMNNKRKKQNEKGKYVLIAIALEQLAPRRLGRSGLVLCNS
jgi:hypothetical protein